MLPREQPRVAIIAAEVQLEQLDGRYGQSHDALDQRGAGEALRWTKTATPHGATTISAGVERLSKISERERGPGGGVGGSEVP